MEDSLSLDGYSFGTLWQEATQAVGYTWSALMTGLSDILGTKRQAQTEQERYRQYGKVQTFEALVNSGANNAPLIVGLLVILVLVAVYFYTNKKKQS